MSLLVVDAVGAPREMGRAHGEHARPLIEQAMHGWREAMSAAGKEPSALVTSLARRAGFRDAVARHLPWMLEEIDGIAEAAGLSSDDIFAMNCLDEAWWWGAPPAGCSTVAIAGVDGRPAVCGQTMDLDDWMNGTQIALRTSGATAPATAMLSRAGMVGLCGGNDAGVAVLVNALSDLPVSTNGVPVAFVLRAVLSARSVNDAATILQRLPHASGQAYTLVSTEGVIGLECAAGVVCEYVNDPHEPNRLWHTNHALSAAPIAEAEDDSLQRLEAVEQQVDQLRTADDVKALLADGTSGVCMYPNRWPGPWETFGAVAVELGTTMRVDISAGPPDRAPWHEVPFIG